jgi:hypothetical protein
MGFLDDWKLSFDEINELLTNNPSLRSFVSGYTAELKARKIYFEPDKRVSEIGKADDHDRTTKGDIFFTYKGLRFDVEVKSLQTNSIKKAADGTMTAVFQCDASDRRPVELSDGTRFETTSLLVGEFDLLAVNLFGFYGEWKFVFAKNSDLPRLKGQRGAGKALTESQRNELLATSMPMQHPHIHPYRDEPWSILDELVESRRTAGTTDQKS